MNATLAAALLAVAASAQTVSAPRVRVGLPALPATFLSAPTAGTLPALPLLNTLPSLSFSAAGEIVPVVPAAAEPVEEHPTRHEGLAMGVVADPVKDLGGKAFLFHEFQHMAFSVLTEDMSGLGEPNESPLEHKHVVREQIVDGKRMYRHDYGWLALGSTPEGEYPIIFTDKGLAFTAKVEKRDKSTTEERMKSARRMVKEAFDEKDEPGLAYGEGVPEKIQAFMTPHTQIIGRVLPDYERYLREDPTLDEGERADRLGQLDSLREFHREIIEGRSRYTNLSPVVAQLLAREASILSDYDRYQRENPAVGRVSAQLHSEQLSHYRGVMKTLHDVYTEAERLGPPGLAARVWGKTVELYTRLRIWLATRRPF